MGYGVPAAVGIKRLYPERTVVCVAGDGDFLMNGQEFATAVQYDLPIIVVIMDNGTYGTIRMHQEREYPDARGRHRPAQSGLRRLCEGVRRLRRDGGEDRGFRRRRSRTAEKSGKPAIIHLKVDTDALTPGASLETIRAQGAGQAEELPHRTACAPVGYR